MISDEDDVTKVVTSLVTDMSSMFQDEILTLTKN